MIENDAKFDSNFGKEVLVRGLLDKHPNLFLKPKVISRPPSRAGEPPPPPRGSIVHRAAASQSCCCCRADDDVRRGQEARPKLHEGLVKVSCLHLSLLRLCCPVSSSLNRLHVLLPSPIPPPTIPRQIRLDRRTRWGRVLSGQPLGAACLRRNADAFDQIRRGWKW